MPNIKRKVKFYSGTYGHLYNADTCGCPLGVRNNVQNFAARIITRSQKFDHITPDLKELKWLSVESMLAYRDCILVFKCLRGLAPDYLAKKFKKRSEIHNKDTRDKNKMDIPGYRTAAGQRAFHYRAVSLWNSLPERLTELTNLASIKKKLMRHFQREC